MSLNWSYGLNVSINTGTMHLKIQHTLRIKKAGIDPSLWQTAQCGMLRDQHTQTM